jgi:transmembrane protein 222
MLPIEKITNPELNPVEKTMPLIDPSIEKFPYCIVWTPIPCITWFFPFIGHTGIGDSEGVIRDFAGPYHIGVGSLAFGKPVRYLQLNPDKCSAQDWDTSVMEGCRIYKGRMHNLFMDNCHSHVAKCLNIMGYGKNFHNFLYSFFICHCQEQKKIY